MKFSFRLPKIPYSIFLLGPSLLTYIGIICNKLAIIANGGQMPVLVPGGCPVNGYGEEWALHSCLTAATHLKFLCDILVWRDGVSSIGDAFITAGQDSTLFALIIWATLVIKRFNVDHPHGS